MSDEQMKQWLERVYNTADDEIDCDQAGELMAAYVDAIIEGSINDDLFDALRLHLSQCPDCSDLYENLYLVSYLEDKGELLTAADLSTDLAPDNIDLFPANLPQNE